MNILDKISSKVPQFFRHPLIAGIGAIVSGISCSFISDYSITNVWKSTTVDYLVVKFLAILLACPWLYVALSGVLIFLNCCASYENTKTLEKDKKNLEKDLGDNRIKITNQEYEIKRLNSDINSYQENIEKCEKQIADLQNRIAVDWLKHVFKNHNLGSNERVTVYFELEGEFNLLARYSSNPSYKEIHTQKFPLNRGVISQAWSHGQHIENKCPKYNESNTRHLDYMTQTYGFSKEEVNNFQMKSCWYVAVAISKADDNIGVIVFESTNLNVLEGKGIEDLINHCNNEQSYLALYIEESNVLLAAKRMKSSTKDADNELIVSLKKGDSDE